MKKMLFFICFISCHYSRPMEAPLKNDLKTSDPKPMIQTWIYLHYYVDNMIKTSGVPLILVPKLNATVDPQWTNLNHHWLSRPFDGCPEKARHSIKTTLITEQMITHTLAHGDLEVFKVLVEEGNIPVYQNIDLFRRENWRAPFYNPLHYAALFNQSHIIHYLINTKKVNPNIIEPVTRNTALHLATLYSNIGAIKALLHYPELFPIDFNIVNHNNQTVFDCIQPDLCPVKKNSIKQLLDTHQKKVLAMEQARRQRIADLFKTLHGIHKRNKYV